MPQVEGMIGVEVGFGVTHLTEAPANRQSASLHQPGLRTCQARQNGQVDISHRMDTLHIHPALLQKILSWNCYL